MILDIFNPSLELLASSSGATEWMEEPPFDMPDGRRVVRRARIASQDRSNQTNQVELEYSVTFPGGRHERVVETFAMRYLFRFEAEHLLARCGFEVLHLYGDYHWNSHGPSHPEDLVFVAGKAGK